VAEDEEWAVRVKGKREKGVIALWGLRWLDYYREVKVRYGGGTKV
jgi:hypothetical protein